MKHTLYKTLKIFLTILVTTLPSMATDQPNQYDSDSDEIILLPIKQNIETQRNYHTFDPQPDQPILWPDEEIPYNARELADVENLYKMPDEIKSYCGFCLGRMQCSDSYYLDKHSSHYLVKHPRQDCLRFPKPFSFLIKGLMGMGATITGIICGRDPVLYIVPVVLGAALGVSLIPELIDLIYWLEKRYEGDSDFNQGIDRGRLCLPEDACSCTSLFGYNFYKVRWCK